MQLWDVGSRSRVGRAIVPGAGSVFAVAFNRGRHAAGDRQRRAARPVGRGHPGPSRKADEGLGRRRPERRVRSDRPARRRRRCDRPARVWRVTDQRPAFPPLTGIPARSPVRPSTRPARSSRPRASSAGPGSGIPPRASATARSWSEAAMARTRSGAVHRPSLPGAAQRVQPGRQAAGRLRESRRRDAVGRRSRGLARARVRDRGAEPEPRGVESPPAGRDRRIARRARSGPPAERARSACRSLAERSETVPSAQPTVGLPSGIVPSAREPVTLDAVDRRIRGGAR